MSKRPKLTIREQEFMEFLQGKFAHKTLPSQSMLADKFGVHQTRISQLIARLTVKGYIIKKSIALATRANGKGKAK